MILFRMVRLLLLRWMIVPIILSADHMEVLSQITLEFTVSEECAPGTYVGSLVAHASVSNANALYLVDKPAFQLLTQTPYFRLNDTSGDLFTHSLIDRERICPETPPTNSYQNQISNPPKDFSTYNNQWTADCRVQLQILHFTQNSLLPTSGNNAHKVLIVNVIILDINDNPPSWSESVIQLAVPEHTAIGQRFPIPTAFDPDCGLANTTVSYTLMDSTQVHENRQNSLDLLATEGIFVLDSELVSTTAHMNMQSDSWNRPTGGCSRRLFQLWLRITRDVDFDEKSKVLDNRSPADLAFNRNSIHLRQLQLKLIATDGGQPIALTGTVTINITITDTNDHVPKFRTQRRLGVNPKGSASWSTASTDEDIVEVEENTPIGRTIYTARAIDVDDCDRNKLTFYFDSTVSGSVRAMFEINAKTGDVILLQSPDYEKQKSFVLPLIVSDEKHRSSMNLLVQVLNRNDHAPAITIQLVGQKRTVDSKDQFGKSTFLNGRSVTLYVTEHDPPGMFIATVTVTDVDETDESSKNLNSPLPTLSMSHSASALYSNRNRFENDEIIRCQINHAGLTLQPLFEGAVNQFKLLTGAVFDREQQAEQYATLTCYDRGQPPLSSQLGLHIIVEDVNDHPPVFKSGRMIAYVKENEPAGTKIHTVEATDMDSGTNAYLGFSLIGENQDDLHIDSSTGVVTSLRSFDREVQSLLNVTVVVFDRADVKQHFDNYTPHDFVRFRQAHSKKDLSDRYIVKGNLIIHIQDVNDCAPTFASTLYQLSVPEDAKINHMVGQIQANDSDATEANNKVNYVIRHQTDNQIVQEFRVSPQGFIYVSRGNLDREKVPTYNFYLVAVDSGVPALSSTTQVHIYVTDVNDNSPTWVFPAYNNQVINMTVNEPVGFRLAQLNAIDPDEAENGEVAYRIVQVSRISLREQFERTQEISANQQPTTEAQTFRSQLYDEVIGQIPATGRQTVTNLFELDSSSGSIYVSRSMSLDDIGTVKLVVEASDRGNPPKLSHRVLQVNIHRYMLQTSPHFNVDHESGLLNTAEKTRYRSNQMSNGGHYENDLIVIVIMVAVTLIISLALIIAILFLRCGLCPTRRMIHYSSGHRNDCHRDMEHTHHLEEVFRDSAKVDDMLIDGTEQFGDCNHFVDHSLSRYQTNNMNDQMCRSYLSTPGNDPWNFSPKKEFSSGYEAFKCNRLCGTMSRVQTPNEKHPLEKRINVGTLFSRQPQLDNECFETPTLSSSTNHEWNGIAGKNAALLRSHVIPCSTFRASCSHLTTPQGHSTCRTNTRMDDVDSVDSGHGCSRTTENDAGSPQDDSSPSKVAQSAHAPTSLSSTTAAAAAATAVTAFRCLTPQTKQPGRFAKISRESPFPERPVKPLARSRSGTLPPTLKTDSGNCVHSAKSTTELCVQMIGEPYYSGKSGQINKTKQSVSWLDPDYQTCDRSPHVACLINGQQNCRSPTFKEISDQTDRTLILLSGVDPLGYAQLMHPHQCNSGERRTSSPNECSSFSTSFV